MFRALLIAAAILVFASVLAVSYTGGLYLVLGIFIAWPVELIIRHLSQRVEASYGLVLIAVTFMALLLAFPVYYVYQHGPCGILPCSTIKPGVSSHNIVVTVNDLDADAFSVSEAFTIEPERGQLPEQNVHPTIINLPDKRIDGEPSGFFLRRLRIQGPSKRTVSVQESDGTLRDVNLCGYYCNEVSVALKDFPRQSFYVANSAQGLIIPNHPGNITISWTVPSVYNGRAEDIVIWYHPSKSLEAIS